MAESVKKQPKMCGVCGTVLDQWLGQWIHAGEVVGHTDHIAVPVDYDEGRLVPKCDFCADSVALEERWVLPAEDFTVPLIGSRSRGGWLACPVCAPLIAEGDWEAVAARHMVQRQQPDATLHNWLLELYGVLATHATEPVRRFRPGDEAAFPEED